MKKRKKTKAPRRVSELDRLAAKLRTALGRETTNIIEIGKLLNESRKHLEHGEWQPWLAENFDLTYRTALNYVSAAEYVARKSETVSHFTNLAPTVLYRLAAGHFNEQEEAAILAAARERRVDEDAAWAISEALAPPDDDDTDDADDQEDGGEDGGADPEEDPEIEAILAAGADPAVPPPAPLPPPPDFALRDFDAAIDTLKRLMTKPSAQFDGTRHGGDELQSVIDFVNAVIRAVTKTKAAAANGGMESACQRSVPP